MKNAEIGIIGGGQLGMLLLQAAIPFPCTVSVFDPNPECSAAGFAHRFVQGDFSDKEALMAFGSSCDVVIYENERVNIEALFALQEQGVRVVSSAESLEWIQDKGIQRQKLDEAGFPCPQYKLVSAEEVSSYEGPFPVVQKWRSGGYDGKGVMMIRSAEDLKSAAAEDSVFEEKIDIEKELSMIVARNESGETKVYPAVEMVFDPSLNLLDYLLAPAEIAVEIEAELKRLTLEMAEKLNFVGIYAIEFFLSTAGKLYVNEISPRVHNSGHHTISANITSQYEQAIRIALQLPLGETHTLQSCLLANLVADHSTGLTNYIGLEEAYKIPKIQFTLYGKKKVTPGRKMGHALILSDSKTEALESLKRLRETLTISSYDSNS